MKVIEKTSTRLVLRSLPVVILIGASIFFLGGCFIVALMAQQTTLDCERTAGTQGECRILASGVFGSSTQSIPLNAMKEATLESTTDSKHNSVYRLVLMTETGAIPFSGIYSSQQQNEQAEADLVNRFISDPAMTSLQLDEGSRWMMIYGIPLILVGLWFAHNKASIETWTFDKDRKIFSIRRRGLFRSHTAEYPFGEIASIGAAAFHDVKTEYVNRTNAGVLGLLRAFTGGGLELRRGRTMPAAYGLAVQLKTGEVFVPNSTYASTQEGEQETVSMIRKFLGSDFDPSAANGARGRNDNIPTGKESI